MAVVLISATRASLPDFMQTTWLGASLQRLAFDPRIRAHVAFDNRAGLPLVYNAGLATCRDDDIAVFLHDDVRLDDYHLADRLLEALRHYDVVGVAGNRRRSPGQPGWGFVNDQGQWDESFYLSGSVAHGEQGRVSHFGPTPADCELLDGLLLGARVDRLRAAGVQFDVGFDFHLYDLDFCRSCRAAGLRLGTWPLAVTHRSSGNFNSAWRAALPTYFAKWRD